MLAGIGVLEQDRGSLLLVWERDRDRDKYC